MQRARVPVQNGSFWRFPYAGHSTLGFSLEKTWKTTFPTLPRVLNEYS